MKIKDARISEISFVEKGANRRQFFVVKTESQGKDQVLGEIEGTGGPECSLNGTKHCICPECGNIIERTPAEAGTPCSERKCPKCGVFMRDSNPREVTKMDELLELLKEWGERDLTAEELEKAKGIPEAAVDAIKKALRVLKGYAEDFPGDVKKAIGILASAAGYGYPSKAEAYPKPKEKSEDVKKELEPEKKESEPEPQKKESDPALQALVTQVTELSKSLGLVDKRFERIEDALSLSKSEDVPPEGKTGSSKWPSFQMD